LRAVDPQQVTVRSDGNEIAALDWGGDGPPLLLQHPNGFCAGVFDPLARALRGEFRPIGVDIRGHGGSTAPDDLAECTFAAGARDVLAVLDALGIDEIVALGQSMGGGVALIADSMRPGIVRKVLLCEAIAFPRLGPSGGGNDNPMVAAARKRRAQWPDRATATASYATRPPLGVMERAALEGYVRYGFRDRTDGTVELACQPEVEARYYQSAGEADGASLAYAHLRAIAAPVAVVAGSDTNLDPRWFVDQAQVAGGTHRVVAGTHFFVQEDTARAADLVRAHLSW
jgi:pimeloyl-ACP methyl ester carboxylesterase